MSERSPQSTGPAGPTRLEAGGGGEVAQARPVQVPEEECLSRRRRRRRNDRSGKQRRRRAALT